MTVELQAAYRARCKSQGRAGARPDSALWVGGASTGCDEATCEMSHSERGSEAGGVHGTADKASSKLSTSQFIVAVAVLIKGRHSCEEQRV